MVDALQPGFAFGSQSGNSKAHRGAQVGRHHWRTGQFLYTAHHRRAALGFDIGAHPVELGNMHVAILEDGFGEHARAAGEAEHRHQLRLHVGGQAGIRCGRKGQRSELAVR